MSTFDGVQRVFPNSGIRYICAEIIKFRKQLTVRSEFKSQSGWGNALNAYMVEELERLADTLENITYNPEPKSKDQLELEASDTTRSLEQDYNAYALSSDNVLQPTAIVRTLDWVLDGSDPDIPEVTKAAFPNDHGRAFITGLDEFFTEMTRLDSRFQANSITRHESVMMRAKLGELFTILQRKGGEANRSDIPTGTLPSQEPGAVNK